MEKSISLLFLLFTFFLIKKQQKIKAAENFVQKFSKAGLALCRVFLFCREFLQPFRDSVLEETGFGGRNSFRMTFFLIKFLAATVIQKLKIIIKISN